MNYILYIEMKTENQIVSNPSNEEIFQAIEHLNSEGFYYIILEPEFAVKDFSFMQCILNEDKYHLEVSLGQGDNFKIYQYETNNINEIKEFFKLYASGITPTINNWNIILDNSKRQSNLEKGAERDYVKIVKWALKASEQGNVCAQHLLGLCFFCGYGIEKNYTQAVKWFFLSEKQGSRSSAYFLMLCYKKGLGVKRDYSKAVEFFKKQYIGTIEEQLKLAHCFYDGKGIKRDYNIAFEIFSKLAKQSNAEAQFMLGNCYFWGQGVSKNYSDAMEHWKKAAGQGHKGAYYMINDKSYQVDGLCYKLAGFSEYKKQKPENILDLGIEDMDLSVRSYNNLKKAGINVLEDIIKLTEDELLAIKNLGIKSFNEINSIIKNYGLNFKDNI